ncbi:BatD family protein [Shewanella xiamenensis]|uniref:BatD family protein n=1 Tax=Shewanella xiamenensis TaxID=332186 RepID=UPI0021505ED0|nr:BatD family protein [Shewanella xiamenensis]MCR4533188.1 BatD family protein [Shewanella xiamenensis]MDI5834986.1 BatD family protein [Shewanella xiamenensis]MDI5839241.1 BatD family protein [Shewanella xiamenensis]MDI5845475.1 BatD family protein [Shewanella xiamenensis]MDI5847797.1 BatD family protein [Shewanella xiamenensis]
MVIRQFFILLILCIAVINPAFALSKLEASVDRNPVMEGEYFVLNVSADDEVDTGKLDTSILLKDFIVGRTSVSRSTQIMNFDAVKETRWQVLLAPKQKGQLTIPSFSIDGVSSAEIPLKVVEAGAQPEQAKNLFIDAKVSSDEAYVGQLITYKVKLYLAVELQRGVLNAPVIEGAQIKQIGEDKDGSEIIDGRRYRVIERTYGIIPDLPGQVNIKGATFSGDVLVESQRRGGMFGFNESRPMQAGAPSLSIQVNPAPASFQGQWLVADLVVLKESFPEDVKEFTVGSPITRTITLLASNADENSLPDIVQGLPPELKSYPEKPQRQSFVRDAQIVSQYSITSAIVPSKAGTFTLPEVKVPWWNPHLKRQEIATLPARTIEVKGGAVVDTPIEPNWQANTSTRNEGSWSANLFALLWLVTLIAWGVTLVAWRRALKRQRPVNTQVQPQPLVLGNGLKGLEQACARGHVSDILQQLQQYFSEQAARPMTLDKIAAQSNELAEAIRQLQALAYGGKANSGTQLADAVKALLSAVKSGNLKTMVQPSTPLRPLNPNG